MAIQSSQLYSNNFGFGLGNRGVVSQDNGFGFESEFYSNLQHKQQQQQQQQFMEFQQQHQQQQQTFDQFKNESWYEFGPKHNDHSVNLPGTIFAQMEKQKQEIDHFLCIQNEKLRLALLEHRKQQVATILRKYESRAMVLLRQKDEEIAKALSKRLELENAIRAMEVESETWQRVAKENEAIIVSLNNTIEHLKVSNVCLSMNDHNNDNNGVVEDAESCWDDNREVEFQKDEEEDRRRMICRSCNSWNSCVIFLPCRHLCACKACEAFLDSCPVCGMVKKSIIEALF